MENPDRTKNQSDSRLRYRALLGKKLKYSDMAQKLSGQTSIFSVVFFVSKSLLGTERQKPQSHVRILISNVAYWKDLGIRDLRGEGRLFFSGYGLTSNLGVFPDMLSLF